MEPQLSLGGSSGGGINGGGGASDDDCSGGNCHNDGDGNDTGDVRLVVVMTRGDDQFVF